MKKITAITGHYGCGKSTFATNLAIKSALNGEKITICDMDTVNPYFRTADLENLFEGLDIKLIAPLFAGTNLDVPVLQYNIEGLAREDRNIIIDMGGDDVGAYPLGRYRELMHSLGDTAELLYVVSFSRNLTETPEDAAQSLREIEVACGIKAKGIVNNSNLSFETNAALINKAIEKAEQLSSITGLPILYTTYTEGINPSDINAENLFEIKRYIKNIWE